MFLSPDPATPRAVPSHAPVTATRAAVSIGNLCELIERLRLRDKEPNCRNRVCPSRDLHRLEPRAQAARAFVDRGEICRDLGHGNTLMFDRMALGRDTLPNRLHQPLRAADLFDRMT